MWVLSVEFDFVWYTTWLEVVMISSIKKPMHIKISFYYYQYKIRHVFNFIV